MTPNRLTPDAFRDAPKTQVRVVLENIRSGLNVGAFFRTGDSLRIEGIDLCGYTAHPPQRDILKSALGATEHVTWTAHENALDAIAALREQGFSIAAIEQTTSSTSLIDWQPTPGSKWAFIFGNEVRGVEAETVLASDVTLEIPQFGVKQSLNVSVCGGIVLWDAVQKIGLPV
ncbi:MAG: RNA methyltransferase [Crocinitomicaceae bacterium]|nr:RNA methyltransferase [Crocinitomicaceae bacterium]